jgi:hypothetical protein
VDGERARKKRRAQTKLALLQVASGVLLRADLYGKLVGFGASDLEPAELELFLFERNGMKDSVVPTLLEPLLTMLDGSTLP